MDEYEVDLRDYLTVIWERKWIIVGVVIVAVLAAAVYSYTRPDEYRARALLGYQSDPPMTQIAMPARSETAASVSVSLGLPQANALIPVLESSGDVAVEALNGSDLLRIRTEGPALPAELEARLRASIEALGDFLQQRIGERIAERLNSLDDEIQFFQQQRASLLERIAEREAGRLQALQAQREQVVQQLDRLMNGAADRADDEFAAGASRQASLLALTSQLQVIQGRMAQLESDAASPQPEAGSAYEQRLVELDTHLQALELAQRQYQRLRDTGWTPLSVAQAPQGSDVPVGPNRQLNVVIAGVLGLFVGLLLAFFVHYVQSAPSTTREQPGESPDAES